jgi:hypothetical protein
VPRILGGDDELYSIARTSIGAEQELTPEQSARLRGQTAAELRDDAKQMRRELGMPVDDRPRDEAGRFRERNAVDLHRSMNSLIRQAAGRQ